MSEYFPGGPFLGRARNREAFELAREDFLLDCSNERTARAYKADLEDYAEWCKARGVDPLAPTVSAESDYVDSIRNRGFAESTLARRRSTLRRFLQHLVSQES